MTEHFMQACVTFSKHPQPMECEKSEEYYESETDTNSSKGMEDQPKVIENYRFKLVML